MAAETISPNMDDLQITRGRLMQWLEYTDRRNGLKTVEVEAVIAQNRIEREWQKADEQRIRHLSAIALEAQLQTDILAL
jgi:hypothetical protein